MATDKNNNPRQPNQTGSQVGSPRNQALQKNGPQELKGRNNQNAGSALAEKPMRRKKENKGRTNDE